MIYKCTKCGIPLDRSHDAHYYCRCGGVIKMICPKDQKELPCCPICGKRWNYREESITKELFGDNPSKRHMLGF